MSKHKHCFHTISLGADDMSPDPMKGRKKHGPELWCYISEVIICCFCGDEKK